MKAILRSAILAAGAASTIVMSTTPASAATAATFTGHAVIGCFGCGTYGPAGNSATLNVQGVVDDGVASGLANGSASFTVTEPVGATCVVSGSATGTVSVSTSAGVKGGSFTWSRTGAVAVITVPSISATATAGFAAHATGNICGSRVEAEFAGEIHTTLP